MITNKTISTEETDENNKYQLIQHWEVDGTEEIQRLGISKMIDVGMMSINKGYNMMCSFIEIKKKQGTNALTEALDYIHFKGRNFKLHNSDCQHLWEIADNSIQTCMVSPPYANSQRIYPQGTMEKDQLGSETSTHDYVRDSVVNYYSEVKRVLKKEGSLFINIAESYRKTNCLVISKLTLAMVEDGWYLVGEWVWKKTNPKPVGKIKRLAPTTERILHFVKDPKNYYYREFIHWKEGESFGIQRGCNDAKTGDKKDKVKWSLKKPIKRFRDFLDEQEVSQVIEGAAFNWSELKKIDPDFKHLAPFPTYLPILPILMTSQIGDTILDIFSGTGTTVEVALQLGRKAIGYDTDPLSIKFSKKRLDLVEENLPTIGEIQELENNYLIAA
ncbi:DNA-methyltransferase [Runella salmonicolor]|uniref:Methyltransferase n=1 Tax=Runella salmonicolor TaxID=2950278 RepID=A0ABT1FJG8_9BACT|nr:site-specific DNA-methyltransferase [Runella salmonicolor]MCP1381914.1 site-specific DNA-methyltransferase [Runella salmonicolor]